MGTVWVRDQLQSSSVAEGRLGGLVLLTEAYDHCWGFAIDKKPLAAKKLLQKVFLTLSFHVGGKCSHAPLPWRI